MQVEDADEPAPTITINYRGLCALKSITSGLHAWKQVHGTVAYVECTAQAYSWQRKRG